MTGPKISGAQRVFGNHKWTLFAISAPHLWGRNGSAGVRTGDPFSTSKWKMFPTLFQLGYLDMRRRELGPGESMPGTRQIKLLLS